MPDMKIQLDINIEVTDLVSLLQGVQGLRNDIEHIEKHGPDKQFNKWLDMPIIEFELSTRTTHVLRNHGIYYLGNLVQRTEEEIRQFSNFGKGSLLEVKERLGMVGLHLDMPPPSYVGWSPPDGRAC